MRCEELEAAKQKAINLRYRRPALSSLGWERLNMELSEIEEDCDSVAWAARDGESLLDALDGNEDEAYEFQMAFADLSGRAQQLRDALEENPDMEDYYDDCTVALIGNTYDVVGFDSYEEDYFSLTRYEADLGTTEAGRRVSRWTKAEMIAHIGQCVGTMLAFFDLRQQYENLKATMDIIKGENVSVLQTVSQIEDEYEKACDDWRDCGTFDKLLKSLPDRAWIE